MFIGPKQSILEFVDGGVLEIRKTLGRNTHTYRIDLRPGHADVGTAGKAYLHALPRNAVKDSWEGMLKGQVVSELLEREFRGEIPSRIKSLPRNTQKMFWKLQNKGGALFNWAWKKLIAEQADPRALALARRFPLCHRWPIYSAAANSERARQLIETFPLLGVEIYCPARSWDVRVVQDDRKALGGARDQAPRHR